MKEETKQVITELIYGEGRSPPEGGNPFFDYLIEVIDFAIEDEVAEIIEDYRKKNPPEPLMTLAEFRVKYPGGTLHGLPKPYVCVIPEVREITQQAYISQSEQETYIREQLLKLQEGRKLTKADPHFLQHGSSAAGKSKENVNETSESD